MGINNLEIHLLALRDAADSALVELERLKAEAPQANQNTVDNITRHLQMINEKKWRKKKSK